MFHKVNPFSFSFEFFKAYIVALSKPLIYKIYDYTKGGIDIPDLRMGSYTTKHKTRKWTLVALSYVLGKARINTQAIICNKQR